MLSQPKLRTKILKDNISKIVQQNLQVMDLLVYDVVITTLGSVEMIQDLLASPERKIDAEYKTSTEPLDYGDIVKK